MPHVVTRKGKYVVYGDEGGVLILTREKRIAEHVASKKHKQKKKRRNKSKQKEFDS